MRFSPRDLVMVTGKGERVVVAYYTFFGVTQNGGYI